MYRQADMKAVRQMYRQANVNGICTDRQMKRQEDVKAGKRTGMQMYM